MKNCVLIAITLCLFVTTGANPTHGQIIVAHRGASADAPENTLSSFQAAWQQDADAIEGDFYLTTDKQIVCIHDDTTKRVGGTELFVAKSSLADLENLDVGRWKDEKFAGERIPTLDEVLATVPEGKTLYIEIKCGPEIVPFLKKVLAQSDNVNHQVVIIAFNKHVIEAAKKALPEIPAYWLISFERDKETKAWKPSFESAIATAARIGADGIDVKANGQALDPAFVQRCQQAGLSLHAWTVDKPKLALRLSKLGYASITTNRPAFLRKATDGQLVPPPGTPVGAVGAK